MFRLDRVTDLITQGGWSTAELAEAIGTNYQFVYRLRRGDWADIGGSNLAALARALKTSADYLLGLTDDPRPASAAVGLAPEESRLLVSASAEVREIVRLLDALNADQRDVVRQVARHLIAASAQRAPE